MRKLPSLIALASVALVVAPACVGGEPETPSHEALLAGVHDEAPSWSPDGSKIAFESDRDGNYDIYVVEPDGSSFRRLTRHRADDMGPAWSPDGAKIAFASNRDGRSRIHMMNADGSEQTTITDESGGDDYEPVWSPDGSRIAFVSIAPPCVELPCGELHVMNADGSSRIRLGGGYDPHWSPDGTTILYVATWSSLDTVSKWIQVVTADGTEQTRLLDGGWQPDLSPNGSRVVFSYHEPWESSRIYMMNANGSGLTRVTDSSEFTFDDEPAWSPDGTRIAFVSNPLGHDEIYVMNGDGTEQTRLTASPGANEPPTWSADATWYHSIDSVSWSPDGTRIAFVVSSLLDLPDGRMFPGYRTSVWVINADGTGQTNLTPGR